jgi:hypothetical protein
VDLERVGVAFDEGDFVPRPVELGHAHGHGGMRRRPDGPGK